MEPVKETYTQLEVLKYTIVTTIGGVDYEGFPTSEINYLQRLRILVEKEKRLAIAVKTLEQYADPSNWIETRITRENCKHPNDVGQTHSEWIGYGIGVDIAAKGREAKC